MCFGGVALEGAQTGGVGVNGNNSLNKRSTDTRFLYSLFQSTYILIMYWYIKTV
ncbi:hypothetical protein PO909_008711 [Leuciscus waleckii]